MHVEEDDLVLVLGAVRGEGELLDFVGEGGERDPVVNFEEAVKRKDLGEGGKGLLGEFGEFGSELVGWDCLDYVP